MAAAAAAAPAIDIDSFDEEDPQAFYLWERREEMESLADACLIVEGVRLPVHTQVLSLASGVLCRLFADLRSAEGEAGGAAAGTRSRKRKAEDPEQLQELTLEAPFVGFSLQAVALFLRLLYDQRWQTSAAATLGALHGSLAALLRLAHQLEAQQLLGTLCSYMADCSTASSSLLMDWLEAAEACQLDALRTSCLLRLAHSLAGWGDSLAASLAHASLLERCDKRTLTQLLGIMTAAGKRRTGDQPLADAIPSAAEVDNSIAEAANPATFSWTLERFSERPFGVGDRILSPEFHAAGHSWLLRAFPGGITLEHEGFVGVRLERMSRSQDVHASFSVEALDAAGKARIRCQARPKVFKSGDRRGWNQFASREELTQKGLLEGDSLRLRVTVTLLP